MKACAVDIDGIWHEVYKDPKTDPGKVSKAGHLAVVYQNGVYRTVTNPNDTDYPEDKLVPVFDTGEMLKRYAIDDIRSRVVAADIMG